MADGATATQINFNFGPLALLTLCSSESKMKGELMSHLILRFSEILDLIVI